MFRGKSASVGKKSVFARESKNDGRPSGLPTSPSSAHKLDLGIKGHSATKKATTAKTAGSGKSLISASKYSLGDPRPSTALGISTSGSRSGDFVVSDSRSMSAMENTRPTSTAASSPPASAALPTDNDSGSGVSRRVEHLRAAQRKRLLQRHDDQSPELMAELEALRDDIQQKETSLSRLRDENERLRRTKASASSPSVMSLAHQLSNVLSIPAAPDASTEQVTERVMEHVIRNMHEVESLRLQVSQLNGNEEAMCSKLVEEQSRSQALEMELAQANRSLADHRKAAADVKVKVAASSQEKSRNASQVELLRNQVKGLESRLVQSELAKARCDAQRAEAESELADLKSGSKDYEKMVKTLTEERDEAKELAQSSMMLHKQETKSLKGCLLLADSATHAEVLDKIVALSDGNGKLSGDNLKLTKDASSTSLELKATKETLKRLAADMKALQKSSASHSEDIRRLEQEKADLTERLEQSSKKCQQLRDQLRTSQANVISAMDHQEGSNQQITTLECSLTALQHAKAVQDESVEELQQCLADALAYGSQYLPSGSYANPTQLLAMVKDLVEMARTEAQENSSLLHNTELLERDLEQAEAERNLSAVELERLQREVVAQNEDKKSLESSLDARMRAKDAVVGDLESQGAAHSYFCQRLCEILKIDQLTKDFGSGIQTEIIIGRVDLLVRQETEQLAEKTVSVHTLQRRLKALKGNLDSKSLHIDVMTKKISALESRNAELNKIVADKQTAAKLEKSQKKVVLQAAANCELLETVKGLEAKLQDYESVKAHSLQQAADVDKLQQTLKNLTESSKKHSKQLSAKQRSLVEAQAQAEAGKEMSGRELKALNTELAATKTALEEVRTREKELLHMRSRIGLIMGLDVNELSAPDYEIMKRLDQLVCAHEAQVTSARSVQMAMQQLQHNFYSGYGEAMQYVGLAQDQVVGDKNLPTPSLSRPGLPQSGAPSSTHLPP